MKENSKLVERLEKLESALAVQGGTIDLLLKRAECLCTPVGLVSPILDQPNQSNTAVNMENVSEVSQRVSYLIERVEEQTEQLRELLNRADF